MEINETLYNVYYDPFSGSAGTAGKKKVLSQTPYVRYSLEDIYSTAVMMSKNISV